MPMGPHEYADGLRNTSYRKTPKNSDTRKIAAITLKLNNVELRRAMFQNADGMGTRLLIELLGS